MFKISNDSPFFRYFYHNFNCGVGNHRSERTVEMPVANYWINKIQNINTIYEIGAVSPYYWGNIVKIIIDPVDRHPYVTHHKSLFDVDIRNKNILSISTVEHIGTGDYHVKEDSNALSALDFISKNANNYLITWGFGYNKLLDDALINNNIDQFGHIYLLTRQKDESWQYVDNYIKLLPYGIGMANSVIILERGDLLN